MENTMTKKQAFTIAVDTLEKMERMESVVEVLKKEVEFLSRPKKSKAESEADVQLKEEIIGFLQNCNSGQTATQIMKGIDSDVSSPKVVAMCRTLIAEGKMYKKKEGKVTLHFLGTEPEAEPEVESAE